MLNQIKRFFGLQQQPLQSLFFIGYCQENWNKKAVELSNQELLKHVLIVGQDGLGQSRLYFYPTMHKMADSFIVIDNGDAYAASLLNESLTKEPEQKRIRFSCSDPESDKFNWIPFCKDDLHFAYAIAQASLLNRNQEIGGFHYGVATDFLAAIYAYTATLDNPTPTTAYNLISNNSSMQIIESLSKSDNKVVSTFLPLVTAMDKKVIAAYLSGIKDKLSWLKNEQVVSFTDTPDLLDFTRLRREKVGVYITISENNLELNQASQALSRIILTCALIQLMQENKGKSVYLFIRHLTDVGYFSYLHGLPQLTERNIGLIACSQNRIDAWLHYYDESATKTILADFHTKIFLEDRPYTEFAKYLPSNQQLSELASLSFFLSRNCQEHLVLINGRDPFQTYPLTLKDVADPYFLNSTTPIVKTSKTKG